MEIRISKSNLTRIQNERWHTVAFDDKCSFAAHLSLYSTRTRYKPYRLANVSYLFRRFMCAVYDVRPSSCLEYWWYHSLPASANSATTNFRRVPMRSFDVISVPATPSIGASTKQNTKVDFIIQKYEQTCPNRIIDIVGCNLYIIVIFKYKLSWMNECVSTTKYLPVSMYGSLINLYILCVEMQTF